MASSPMAERLAELHATAFPQPWSAEAFETLATQPGVIAHVEAEGFILIRVTVDEAEILTLAVRPTARRAGVASRLVRAAVDEAVVRGAERLFLEVAEDNCAARALYDNLGFEVAGRRPRYYQRDPAPAVDALLLVLNLSGRLPSP